MRTYIFGLTSSDLPIPAYHFGHETGSPSARVLILGGVHGDEIEGLWAAYGLLKEFATEFPFDLELILVPCLNIDGMLRRERRNFRGVDLNRNMATQDWTNVAASERYFPGSNANSEPEVLALISCLESFQPHLIVSLHSWKPMLNINGPCRPEAEEIARCTGYAVEETIGYPTPGCLGTYAGLERAMPTITYEIERGLEQAAVLNLHVPAILKALKVAERHRVLLLDNEGVRS